MLSRAMGAWQARVQEYRRKKERLQLAQEFRNKTLLWQALSRWLYFQVRMNASKCSPEKGHEAEFASGSLSHLV